ncbi:MAG: autotransporter assembly complex family protein [Thermodesulfobacteriota bacterium]|nr:autotransporter assembly complex family protein [Thermodesulfobacteriota bacterium]
MTAGEKTYSNANEKKWPSLAIRHGTTPSGHCFRPQVVFVFLFCLAFISLEHTVFAKPSGLDYQATITGVEEKELRKTLEEISDVVILRKERPPVSLSQLRRRAEGDVPLLTKAFRAEGYYGGQVKLHIDAQKVPVRVTFQVDLGPVYLLKSVDIETAGAAPSGLRLPEPEQIGLQKGEPARARIILDGEEKLLGLMKSRGFPFSTIDERKVLVDHADRSVAVHFRIEPGPAARFGTLKITGLQSVDEDLVRGKIPWKQGDAYNADFLVEVQRGLTKTGLFAMVRVTPDQHLDERGLLPITIGVTERKHRSVGAGVSYKTDEGPGAKISWEHRNLFHHGERLTLTATASDFTRAAEGTARKPSLWRPDQTLLLNVRVAEDRPEAYTSRNLRSSALVERDLGKGMTIGGGLAFKTSTVTQLDEEESFSLVSSPWHFDWDTRDDVLEPTYGGRLVFQLTPYFDVVGEDFAFLKGKVSLSRCLEMVDNPSTLVAARVAVGSMVGASRDAIPADERFYAGGGGSIRGYPFQTVGPLEEDEPLGGRSLFELSTELRLKVTDRIGLVAFLDGGTAFETTSPDFSHTLGWGTGLGLRYFTPIGPFRLDVGVPLNRRPEIDDSFQVYVSLGEAFYVGFAPISTS